MCGIAGVLGKSDVSTVRAMLGQMAHRGPDDEHFVSGDLYCLGARRLSIVGLADGRQPLSNVQETVWAAQNGELYNYPAVRDRLLAAGKKLRTHCDTEILVHLYEEYGVDLIDHIDGMFAVSIWDDVNKIGMLARDRMGKKPLYYWENNGAVFYASEIKSLLRIPGFQRRINIQSLNHYLSFKHVPAPDTIFEGIKILLPGHRLVFGPGKPVQITKYWELDFTPDPALSEASEDELTEKLLDLLRAGVKKRLMADVPIGFFLSGGIDSSLSTALAAEMSSDPIKTFTLTYADGSTTGGKELDRKWADWTAKKYRTEHYEETVRFSQFPENLRKIIGCFDEPFCGTVSTYFLAGLIARHVKVAISGDGADELFGSYLSHRLATPLANYPEFLRTGNRDLIRPFESGEQLAPYYEKNEWDWRSKLFVHNDEQKASLLNPELAPNMVSSRELLKREFAKLSAVDPLNRVLEAEFKTIFADQVLAFVDRLSMAHSLEIRSAYLDTELVQFAAKVPGHLKIHQGETKYLLKKAALKYFPEDMVFRKKEGFLMPITEWILSDLESYVRETLSPERLDKHNLFNVQTVQQLVSQLYDQKCDYTHVNKVYSLIVFQEWFEQYMSESEHTAVPTECVARVGSARA